MYKVRLVAKNKITLDEKDVATDEELFAFLGHCSFWYFLFIQRYDANDARFGKPSNDQLLLFTTTKANDYEGHGNRHGLPTGILAYGDLIFDGDKQDVKITIESVN